MRKYLIPLVTVGSIILVTLFLFSSNVDNVIKRHQGTKDKLLDGTNINISHIQQVVFAGKSQVIHDSGSAAPASGSAAPASGSVQPASGSAAPASGSAAPASGSAAPASGSGASGSSSGANPAETLACIKAADAKCKASLISDIQALPAGEQDKAQNDVIAQIQDFNKKLAQIGTPDSKIQNIDDIKNTLQPNIGAGTTPGQKYWKCERDNAFVACITKPASSSSAAPASGSASSGSAAPASGSAAPASGSAAPASGSAAPASGSAAPASGSAAPVPSSAKQI